MDLSFLGVLGDLVVNEPDGFDFRWSCVCLRALTLPALLGGLLRVV